mmetsp:Transcript_22000/g.41427  ORF Transcript_22000/g.41427 Transcript_22000/m.41427 type:complete len:387 (+) Transcript_22000:26-1186(+)
MPANSGRCAHVLLPLFQVGEKHRASEGQVLGLLNHLLVDAWRRLRHDYSALLRINPCVELRVLDQLDNPNFSLLSFHVQLRSDHPNVDALVDPAVGLEDQKTSILLEILPMALQEVIDFADLLAFLQLKLSLVKIHLDVQGHEKSGDWIAIDCGLVLDDPNGVLHQVLQPLLQDEARGDVAEEVRAREGDAGQALLVQEEIQQLHFHLFGGKDREEGPVKEPCPLKQDFLLGHLRVVQEVVDLEDHVCCSLRPVRGLFKLAVQDERCQRTPNAADLLRSHHWALRVLGDHPPIVLEELPAEGVVSTVVLQLCVMHQSINDCRVQVEVRAEFVNALALCHLLDLLLFLQNLQQRKDLLARVFQLLQDQISPVDELLRLLLADHGVSL